MLLIQYSKFSLYLLNQQAITGIRNIDFDMDSAMDYYKYLTINNEDIQWGLNVVNVGATQSSPATLYPPKDHPAHHRFNWENGRVLEEYQIIYITKGEGIFESEHQSRTKVEPGTLIYLFPNEWHRYKPNPKTGWDEYWIGYKGPFANHLYKQNKISIEKPLIHVGFQDDLFQLFVKIIEITKTEKPGYQPVVGAITLQILGLVASINKEKAFDHLQIDSIIQQAKILLMEKHNPPLFTTEVADRLNVGYSWFRKIFKEYTGLAPGQFQMQHRINLAKNMLVDKNKSIKEIAYSLGFDSNFYFAKIFKDKTGFSPSKYRKKYFG